MKRAIVSDGKVYVTDEQWITIGGEDEDGSGKHVLINGSGTIVAGFGKGRNVKNAFGGKKADTPEKANETVKNKYSEYGGYKAPEFRGTKEEIFKQATENVKKAEAEKRERETTQARKTLKDIDKRIAQAKADGDGKRVSFLEATKNSAEKTLKANTPEKANAVVKEKTAQPRNTYKNLKAEYDKQRAILYKTNDTEGRKNLVAKMNELKAKMDKKYPGRLDKEEKERISKEIAAERKEREKKEKQAAKERAVIERKIAKIKGGGRVKYDDDPVKIYRNGELEYDGIEDYSPYHHEDGWRWNEEKKYYVMKNGNETYIMVGPKKNGTSWY